MRNSSVPCIASLDLLMSEYTAKRVVLTDQDFQWALKGFTPSVLLNVPLLPPGDLTWNDVGGLQDVRQVLQQTLLWPSKVGNILTFQ